MRKFKFGFTLTEIVAAIVVLTIVVAATIQITRSKMEKVDKYSYYMAYTVASDFAKNIKAVPEEKSCLVKPMFIPTKLNCNDSESEGYEYCEGPSYGNEKKFENDVWAGARYDCAKAGGQLPSDIQLTQIAADIYGVTPIPTSRSGINGNFNSSKAKKYGIILNNGSMALWSDVETSDYIPGTAYNVTLDGASARWYRNSRNRYDYQGYNAICVKSSGCNPVITESEVSALCKMIKDNYNISSSACDIKPVDIQAAVISGEFKDQTPHIKLSNGLTVYIASDLIKIPQLTDANADPNQDINVPADNVGYLVYIDYNGNSGKGKLWKDVFPFYITTTGKAIPAYDNNGIAGANNTEHLAFNVFYDDYSSGNREHKLLLHDVTSQVAACRAGVVTSTTYCENNPIKTSPCNKLESDCRAEVIKPLKKLLW